MYIWYLFFYTRVLAQDVTISDSNPGWQNVGLISGRMHIFVYLGFIVLLNMTIAYQII